MPDVNHPTGELPIEDICQKDVPAGTPYLIVSEDDVSLLIAPSVVLGKLISATLTATALVLMLGLHNRRHPNDYY
jgi:hypothetical protein